MKTISIKKVSKAIKVAYGVSDNGNANGNANGNDNGNGNYLTSLTHSGRSVKRQAFHCHVFRGSAL